MCVHVWLWVCLCVCVRVICTGVLFVCVSVCVHVSHTHTFRQARACRARTLPHTSFVLSTFLSHTLSLLHTHLDTHSSLTLSHMCVCLTCVCLSEWVWGCVCERECVCVSVYLTRVCVWERVLTHTHTPTPLLYSKSSLSLTNYTDTQMQTPCWESRTGPSHVYIEVHHVYTVYIHGIHPHQKDTVTSDMNIARTHRDTDTLERDGTCSKATRFLDQHAQYMSDKPLLSALSTPYDLSTAESAWTNVRPISQTHARSSEQIFCTHLICPQKRHFVLAAKTFFSVVWCVGLFF